jgi:very-short-patch-repair endonuclease
MAGKLTNIARMLRQRSTEAERVLWRKLRARQLEDCKFRRQQQVGSYIVDFINFEKGIIIELDGGQHATNRDRDEEREAWLRGEGFQIIRFWNNDVFQNLEGVLETIRRKLTVPLP